MIVHRINACIKSITKSCTVICLTLTISWIRENLNKLSNFSWSFSKTSWKRQNIFNIYNCAALRYSVKWQHFEFMLIVRVQRVWQFTCKLPFWQYSVNMHWLGGSIQTPMKRTMCSFCISRIWQQKETNICSGHPHATWAHTDHRTSAVLRRQLDFCEQKVALSDIPRSVCDITETLVWRHEGTLMTYVTRSLIWRQRKARW